jgi:hypothetical protein
MPNNNQACAQIKAWLQWLQRRRLGCQFQQAASDNSSAHMKGEQASGGRPHEGSGILPAFALALLCRSGMSMLCKPLLCLFV